LSKESNNIESNNIEGMLNDIRLIANQTYLLMFKAAIEAVEQECGRRKN
jgi:methyl-accepting chemotaxis protein